MQRLSEVEAMKTASSITSKPKSGILISNIPAEISAAAGKFSARRRNEMAHLTVQEAIEALIACHARIRVIDTRSGRWFETEGTPGLVPYLENPALRNAKTVIDSSPRLPIRPEMTTRKILNSWKEIAAYLGRGVRTVQRYEVALGLPVRRAMGHERCAVLAFSDELDAWLQARPMRKQLPISDTAGNGSLAGSRSQIPI
jgi:hypothetical protein